MSRKLTEEQKAARRLKMAENKAKKEADAAVEEVIAELELKKNTLVKGEGEIKLYLGKCPKTGKKLYAKV